MVDAVERSYQEIVVNGNLFYQKSENEGPYLITKGVRSVFGSVFVTDTAVWFRHTYANSDCSNSTYVLPPGAG